MWVALTPWQWVLQKHTSQRDPVVRLAFTVHCWLKHNGHLKHIQQWFSSWGHSVETSKASWSIVVIVLLVSRSIFCFLYGQLLHIWRHWDSSGLTRVPEAHSHWAWRSWTIWRRFSGCFQTDRVLGLFVYTVTKKVTGLAENDLWPGTSDSLLVLNVLQALILALFLFCFIGEIMTLRLVQPPV